MANEQFLKHKIVVAMLSESRQSLHTIEAYSEINFKAGVDSEFSIQYIMEAVKLQDSGHYIEALNMLDKAVLHCQGDLSIKLEAQSLISNIETLTENLALENLSDFRIGLVYENILKRGNVNLYFHAYSALHYQKIGETGKANCLLKKIKNVAPNLNILNARGK